METTVADPNELLGVLDHHKHTLTDASSFDHPLLRTAAAENDPHSRIRKCPTESKGLKRLRDYPLRDEEFDSDPETDSPPLFHPPISKLDDVYEHHFTNKEGFETMIERLKEEARPGVFSPTGLSSPVHQVKILEDMQRKDLPMTYIRVLKSLFCNVENIRFAYREAAMPVPVWYLEKYAHLFSAD